MTKFDVLIIGGGPAAITICKVLGSTKQVGIIRPENYSMIYCAMPYVIENVLPIEKTFKKDELVTHGGACLIRDKAVSIDIEGKTVQTATGRIYGYEKLVIATGASPILPKIEGHDLEGVVTFKTEDDLRAIKAAADNGLKKAVVVGAGAIGIELAQALNKVGVETHLVDMESYILPNMMDPDMIEEAQEKLIAGGIHLHMENKVIALKGETAVEEVIFDHGSSIRFHSMDECSEADKPVPPRGLVVFCGGHASEP